MKWSWKLGEIAGIGIYIHATFLLVIGWVGLTHWRDGQSIEATLVGIGFILALFGCVLLHELGHSLTAKKYGIKTRDITLLPIGGVARLERMPDDPKQELWVALMGPAVNVVIAAVLFISLFLTNSLVPLESMEMTSGPFWERLMMVNLFLVAFNMIPAFPMDGGRVLRALLATRLAYTKATHIAATIGQGIAFIFGFIGLFTNPFLVFIALFVWIGAAQESSMVQIQSSLDGIPVNQAMITNFRTLLPLSTLADAVELTLSGSQQDFPVVEGERVVGVLVQGDLLVALAQQGKDTPVSGVMQTDFETAEAFEMLQTLFVRMQSCNCRTVPVTRFGRLVGLITMENIGEFLRIEAALSQKKL